jgi:uncharacterized protein YcnI
MRFLKTASYRRRSKSGISAIIGGIILFAMVLSVLGTYFFIIQQTSTQYQQYVNLRNGQAIATNRESFSVVAYAKSGTSCNCIFANVTNNGGSTLLITETLVINNSNGVVLHAYNVPITSQGVNSFATASINTTQPFTGGWSYTVKVISSNGNTGQVLFPQPSIQSTRQTVQSLIANGIGSVSMLFRSFYVYKVITSPTCCSVDLAHRYNGSLAPCCSSTPVAFSVQVTNIDPNQAVIALGGESILWGTISCQSGCGSQSSPVWYIGNVNPLNGQISTSFSTIYLRYNTTSTLWFVSSCDLMTCPYSSSTTVSVSTSFTYASFMLLSGDYSANGNASPYGQNLPFQSTFFADNIAVVSNTPGSVTSGTPSQSFTLKVNNTALTPAGDSITKITMTADAGFTSVSYVPMTGWTGSVIGNTITWTAQPGYSIPANSIQQFAWTANVPTVSSNTNYIHVVTITFSAGTVQTEILSGATYVHT